MKMASRQAGAWLVVAAAVLWGTNGTAQAFAPPGYDPKVIGAMRLLVGGSALWLLAACRGEFGRWRDWSWPLVVTGALCIAAYQLCFFAAVNATGVAVGTVIAIGSTPVFGGILGRVFRGERLSGRWWGATGLAVCGCILLGLNSAAVVLNVWGVLLALGAGASYSAYSLLIRGLIDRHPPTAVLATLSCCGAFLLLPVLLRCDPNWFMQWRSIAVIAHLGLVSMALAYWLFASGLRFLPVSAAITLTLAEPMTATILGLVVLGERLSGQSGLGVFLIFAGLFVLLWPWSKKEESF